MRMTLLLLFTLATILHAEDWTTADGKTFKNVTVLSHDDGFVTILDENGGARIMLSQLPSDLRSRFGFDATKANACVAKTEAEDKNDQAAVENERVRTEAAIANQNATSSAAATTTGQADSNPTKVLPVEQLAANEGRIQADQAALDDMQVDIKVATREAARNHFHDHLDSDGEMRANRSGDSPEDHLHDLVMKQMALQKEIHTLWDEDNAARKSQAAPQDH